MITREEYLKNPRDLHQKYYFEIARELGLCAPVDIVQRAVVALAHGDTHLNTIPLHEWDAWSEGVMFFQSSRVRAVFAKRGDFPGRYLTCTLKALVKATVEGKVEPCKDQQ